MVFNDLILDFAEVARELLNGGAHLGIIDNLGKTALALAAENGFFKYFFFTKLGIGVVNFVNLSLFSGNVGVVTVIIEVIIIRKARNSRESLTFDPIDGLKHTPVYFAAMKGHVQVVQLLVGHGATVDYPDSVGWTPLMIAAGHGK